MWGVALLVFSHKGNSRSIAKGRMDLSCTIIVCLNRLSESKQQQVIYRKWLLTCQKYEHGIMERVI